MKDKNPRNERADFSIFSLKESQAHKLDKERSKDVFFFLSLYLEVTGWKTERSRIVQRLEKLSKKHGISIGEVIEILSRIPEREFEKMLLGTINAKTSDSEKKGIEDRMQRKDRKSQPINFDRVSL
ncbi:MAG: hypothetical protein ACFFD4_22460 [Candidatus Odinarchaeota archaeon]